MSRVARCLSFNGIVQRRDAKCCVSTPFYSFPFSPFLLDRLFPLPPAPRYSPIVLAADGSVLHAFLNPTQKWRMKTELAEITPALQQAIIQKEDRYFRYHFGVNPLAIVQAAGRNIFKKGRTTGASTITMQVARLLEPKERSFGNKLLEMLRATQLEAHYSKAEILQLYLNLVPYGGNIEGVNRLPCSTSSSRPTTSRWPRP